MTEPVQSRSAGSESEPIPGFTKRTALEPYGHPIEPVRATRRWEEAVAEYLREERERDGR